MEDQTISLDGTITSWHKADLTPSQLLGCNWIYTTINTLAHKPLHLATKLRYALDSYKTLYGTMPEFGTKELEREIRDVLYFGLHTEGGNTVTLYLIPATDGCCRRLLLHEAVTPYDGYGLLTVRPKAIIANYEIPFGKHHTNVSITAARFADGYASSHGYDVALRADRNGTLHSSGDNPLYALRGSVLYTTPADKGARPSAEREMMARICEMAGVKIVEEELRVEDVASYEELLLFTPAGIQSIYSLGDMRLGNIYANLLSKHLTALTREGFAR